jgi:hypothetical protein
MMLLRHLIFCCFFVASIACVEPAIGGAPGFLEGHLKIVSPKPVEIAGSTPSKMTGANYAEYPLVIRSKDGNKEIARLIAGKDGSYRVALPPGDYILDVQDRRRRHVRASPQPFTVVSDRTVHVDMDIDTGIR